jgi:Tol biopolymer transport system component
MPNSADNKLQEVVRLIKAGNVQAGHRQLREILEANPNDADAWYLASLLTNNPDHSRSALERVLKINPQHVQAQAKLNKLPDKSHSASPGPVPKPQKPSQPPKITPIPHSEKVTPKPGRSRLYLYALIATFFIIVVVVSGVLLFRGRQGSGTQVLDLSNLDNKLLFSENSILNVVSSDGKNIVQVYDNLNQGKDNVWTGLFNLAPDGKHILFGNPEEFFSTDSAGQNQRLFGSGLEPVWSPDGMHIAFSRYVGQQTDIFTADADGSNIKQITTLDTKDIQPVWSPDSKKIAFIRFDTNLPSIYSINSDGTSEAKITDGNTPAWSPDGSKIVFSETAQSGTTISLIGSDGTGKTMLANGSKPRWSPDGRYILFLDNNVVVKIALDGSGKIQLGKGKQFLVSPDSNHIAIWGDAAPFTIVDVNGDNLVSTDFLQSTLVSWSPDSKQIGIEADRVIFVVNLDGTYKNIVNVPWREVTSLSSQRSLGNFFTWLTPAQVNGINAAMDADRQSRIQFSGGGPDHFMMGSAPFTIVSADIDHNDTYVQDPMFSEQQHTAFTNWSPDGQQIALDLRQSKDLLASGIYLMPANMTSLRKLTDGRLPIWSPDGKQIAFLSDSSLLYVIDAQFGASPIKISDQKIDDFYYKWSPDGTRLLFVADKVIFVGNADRSGVTTIGAGRSPDWSNDSKRIVYDGRGGLTIVDANGANAVNLSAQGNHPVWSPDGQRIAFDDGLSILTINPDGSNLQRLTYSASRGIEPAWSADGKRILYRTDTTASELRLINADGSGHRRLPVPSFNTRWVWLPSTITLPSQDFTIYDKTKQPNLRPPLTAAELYGDVTPTVLPTVTEGTVVMLPSPAFTPTSLTPTLVSTALPIVTQAPPTPVPTAAKQAGLLVFSIYTQRTLGTGDLFTMNFDGSDMQRLTEIEGDDLSPNWSPDGAKIVFTSTRDGNSEIYVMNTDGTDQKRLTTNHTDNIQPFWTPDGQRIGFSSWRDGNLEIYVMNADGTDQKRLTQTKELERFYGWSPDGSKMLMVSIYDASTWDGIITVMNADGSGMMHLKLSGETPIWSPDGKHILLASNGGMARHIMMANADGTNVVQISQDGKIDDSQPKWSPDGSAILFTSRRNQQIGLYIMNLDGSNVQLVSQQVDSLSGADWTDATPSAAKPTILSAATALPTTEQLAFVRNGQIFLTNVDGSNRVPLLPGDIIQRWFPSISPNGKMIGYAIDLSERMQFFLMNFDGTDQHKPFDTGDWEGGPVWSPDGKQFAFLSSHRLENNKFESRLNVVNVDGKNPRIVVTRGDGFNLESPNWSPDGKQIVYTVVQRGETALIGKGIYGINVDGSGEHVILVDKFFNFQPVWSPDGKRIAFASRRNEKAQLFVMDANGQNIVALPKAEAAVDSILWSPNGKQIIYGVYQGSNMRKFYILSLDSQEQIPIPELYESIIFWGQLSRPILPTAPGK